ncbi:hypothetical protein BCR34DRAFT_664700 [Clohesyomyces aquaticus]|uniref:Uncharacterized protein n=1 Tax=Clohesyomyces aquaticus TaxID=1231657 RepID=A0A1Y1ZKV0_9PLEO|nr:hypothetical protein BCR34DRAFT_664700 [Clohesyomyces aquaticus]
MPESARASDTLLGDGTQAQPQTRQSRKWTPAAFTWIWETLALFVSFGCLAATIGILKSMQNKSLSQWKPHYDGHPPSLNATIAILTTATKALALFVISSSIAQSKWILFKKSTPPRKLQELDLYEGASRGPLGAFLLLPHLRFRSWVVISGAVVTIAALGMDTFAQQVVKYDTPYEPASGAEFWYTQRYPSTARLTGEDQVTPNQYYADFSMQGAILGGIAGLIPRQAFFNCGSNRCTWNGSYTALGFSSRCVDVTAAALATTNSSGEVLEDRPGVYYRMKTPEGIPIYGFLQPPQVNQIKINVAATQVNSFNGSLRDQKVSPDFIRIAVLSSNMSDEVAVLREDYYSSLSVKECTISLVAHRMTSIMVQDSYLSYQGSDAPLDQGEYAQIGDPTVSNITFTEPKEKVTLRIMPADLASLGQFFESSRFSGYFLTGSQGKSADSSSITDGAGSGVGNTLSDVDTSMRDMTDTMTAQLRSSNYYWDLTAPGSKFVFDTVVRVEWAWLSLPAAILAITLAVLTGTALDNRRARCIPWKSSSVAILRHNIISKDEDGAEVLSTDLRSVKEMEEMAKHTRVKLE